MNGTRRSRTLLILVSFIALQAPLAAQPVKAQQHRVPAELVLERFPMGSAVEGDVLLVPVQIKGQTYSFMLDTGCSASLLDKRLLPGQPLRTVQGQTPNGVADIELYSPVKLTLGQLHLEGQVPVAARDLSMWRKITGHPLHGMLGMDFLRRYVVQLDYDHGEILFLKELPANVGEKLPLIEADEHCPMIRAELPGFGRQLFMLDSGAVGYDTGSLARSVFEGMHERKLLQIVSAVQSTTVSGTTSTPVGSIRSLRVGTLDLNALLVDAVPLSFGILGTRFLSRFVVTFDFPNKAVYLRKSAAFASADRVNDTGLRLLRHEQKTYVESVDDKCLAQRCGFQNEDVVLKVDGRQAATMSMHHLRGVLMERRELAVLVRRGERELTVTLRR